MRSRSIAGPIALTALVACGGSSVEERQADLAQAHALAAIHVTKQEPPASCAPLGAVDARDPKVYAPFASFGANSEGAMESLREKAAERGANYVVLDGVFGPMANGRLFACPPGALGAGPTPAPTAPAAACEPPCSPGFACVRSACVSACNPACAPGQQCGADRVCRPGGG